MREESKMGRNEVTLNEVGKSEGAEVEVFEFCLGCIMSNILVRNPKGVSVVHVSPKLRKGVGHS